MNNPDHWYKVDGRENKTFKRLLLLRQIATTYLTLQAVQHTIMALDSSHQETAEQNL